MVQSSIEGSGRRTNTCKWDGGGDESLACHHEFRTNSATRKYCYCKHYRRCELPGCDEVFEVYRRKPRRTCCSAHKNALAALNHQHEETCQWPGCGKTFVVKSPGEKYCPGPHYGHCGNPDCPLPAGKFITTAPNPNRVQKYCSMRCQNMVTFGVAAEPKICALPGCGKKVSSTSALTCCKEHANRLRRMTKASMTDLTPEQAKEEGLVVKTCAFPGCGAEFVPDRKSAKYCNGDHYVSCEVCGTRIKVGHKNLKRPPRACCPSHAVMLGHTPESKAKRVANSMARWGTKSPLQAEEVKAKIKKTLDEHPELDHRIGSANFQNQIMNK